MLELHVNKIALKKIFRRAVQPGHKMFFVFVLFSKDPSARPFLCTRIPNESRSKKFERTYNFFFLAMSVCNGQHSLCLYV